MTSINCTVSLMPTSQLSSVGNFLVRMSATAMGSTSQMRRPAPPEGDPYLGPIQCATLRVRPIQFAASLSELNVKYAEITEVNATSTHRFLFGECPDSTFRFTLTPSNQALKSALPISMMLARRFKFSDRQRRVVRSADRA